MSGDRERELRLVRAKEALAHAVNSEWSAAVLPEWCEVLLEELEELDRLRKERDG